MMNLSKYRNRRGFTLVELVMAVAIIIIILAIAIPNAKQMRVSANASKAKGDLEMLKTAVESYMIHQDPAGYPGTTNQLWEDYLKNTAPRILEKALYDPFQNGNIEYQYVRSNNGAYYVIWSRGIGGVSSVQGIGDDGVITPANRGDDIYVSNGSTQ